MNKAYSYKAPAGRQRQRGGQMEAGAEAGVGCRCHGAILAPFMPLSPLSPFAQLHCLGGQSTGSVTKAGFGCLWLPCTSVRPMQPCPVLQSGF